LVLSQRRGEIHAGWTIGAMIAAQADTEAVSV
jgi:hypothetical protein